MSVAISDAEGHYGEVIVSGANLRLDPSVFDDPALWRDARAMILQNEIPEAVNIAAAHAARSKGAMVCLNAAPYRPLSSELVSLIDMLVVNVIEAEQLGSHPITDLASAGRAAAVLAQTFPCVVVTAGGDGVAGMRGGEKAILLPALPVALVSTHGAGDVFVGSLIAALAARRPFCESLREANTAAAAHVSTRFEER
jgi:ribokinase